MCIRDSTSVVVAGSSLQVASRLITRRHRRLTPAVRRSRKERRPGTCKYHIRGLRHGRGLLTDDDAQMVACNVVASRLVLGTGTRVAVNTRFIMVALWNRADHYILPCGFFFFLSSFFLFFLA